MRAGLNSIRVATPQRNFGSAGGRRSISGIFALRHDSALHFESCDLWNEVVEQAQQMEASRLILLGFVPQAAVTRLADRVSAAVHAIDLFSDLGQAGDTRVRSLSADFAFPAELDLAYEELRIFDGPTLVVAVNLLEHLTDPRPALAFMRRLLLLDDRNLLLVSSPDRSLFSSTEAAGFYTRLWSYEEMTDLLLASGFEQTNGIRRHAQAELCHQRRLDSLVYARCTLTGYNAFLEQQGLPYVYDPARQIHLVLTDEHAKIASINGGIGSYVQDLECLSDNVWVAYCELPPRIENLPPGLRCLHPRLFWDNTWLGRFDWHNFYHLAYPFIEQILFYYPIVQSIEYQEISGYGARIAQAKRAGLLPKRILLIARCHGSRLSLENGFKRWMPVGEEGQMILEKLSIELADVISIPSRFLKDLYIERGYEMDAGRLHMEPNTCSLAMELPDVPYGPIDTLVFFGRRQLHKGYEEFLQALELMDLANSSIRKIVFFGERRDPTAPNDQERIARIRQSVEVDEYALPRDQIKAQLMSLAPTGLLLLPYRADNAPVSVYEVLSAGCPFLASNQGGIPEQIPEPFHRTVLTDIQPQRLASRIQEACLVPGDIRKSKMAALQAATNEMLEAVRASTHRTVKTCYRDQVQPEASRPTAHRSDLLTVVVSLMSSSASQLSDLCEGLNAQTLPPLEVIFVSDKGGPVAQDKISELVGRTLKFPHCFLEQDSTRNLAEARNRALERVRTRYLISLNGDTIPLSDQFRRLVYAMEYDQSTWAATSYSQALTDSATWRDMAASGADNPAAEFLRQPLGGGIIHSLLENELSDVATCYRTEPVRRIGGWDAAGEARGLDWAMFLKILSHGERILVIPSVDYLYRLRADPTARDETDFSGDCMKARALVLLPPFERFRLIALAKERESLAREVYLLRMQTRRMPYRAMDRLIRLTSYAPRTKRALAWGLRKGYHFWNWGREKQRGILGELAKDLAVTRRYLYKWRTKFDYLEPGQEGPGPNSHQSAYRKRELKRPLTEKTLEVNLFNGALQKIEAQHQDSGASGEAASASKSES